ncbi:MAG TPA: hypothetical protein VNA25_08175, partial [Phycisphaerae bacterium]|nr:hypothetical protein [Phycisphaerae bacterium]
IRGASTSTAKNALGPPIDDPCKIEMPCPVAWRPDGWPDHSCRERALEQEPRIAAHTHTGFGALDSLSTDDADPQKASDLGAINT